MRPVGVVEAAVVDVDVLRVNYVRDKCEEWLLLLSGFMSLFGKFAEKISFSMRLYVYSVSIDLRNLSGAIDFLIIQIGIPLLTCENVSRAV